MATTADNYRARIGAWVKARLLRNPHAIKIDAGELDLFVVRDVLSRQECQDLIDVMDQYLSPSEIMAPHPDPDYRTSYSGNPPPNLPQILALETRLHEVMGIQREVGEAVQGQRYAVGQQFKPHWDYFLMTEDYWPDQLHVGGQRTWTAMLFLNEPEAGGHTNFTKIGVSIRPRTGNLLVWNNLDANGDPNELSMHQGSPVTAGVKYVITKWYRERPWRALPALPSD